MFCGSCLLQISFCDAHTHHSNSLYIGWELLLLDGENEMIEEWIALKEGKAKPVVMALSEHPSEDIEDVEEGNAPYSDVVSEVSA